jgi:transcription antitermination factor NusA-like protein
MQGLATRHVARDHSATRPSHRRHDAVPSGWALSSGRASARSHVHAEPGHVPPPKLRAILKQAAETAAGQYDIVETLHRRIHGDFASFENSMTRMEKQLASLGNRHRKLACDLQTIFETRRQSVHACWEEWSTLFEQRRQDLDHFSIMLFGRTMAGKSTTLEALVGGDGSRIGQGIPDFTRNIDAVEWEGLRVVDTPGIEGFSPETLNVAESFMDRADLVVFVISDDHIEPRLLEELVAILNRRKPLLILLNVKVGNWQRLLRNPDRAFRQDEIGGHTRRIRGYLKQAAKSENVSLDADSVSILPYCAEAANVARNAHDLDDDTRCLLLQASRFPDVLGVLLRTVAERGVGIRMLAAYESFMANLEQIEDGLRFELAAVAAQARTIQRGRNGCRKLFTELERDGRRQFRAVEDHFHTLDVEIDAFADNVIDRHFADPQTQWETRLDLPGVQRSVRRISEQCVAEIRRRTEDFQRRAAVDLRLAADLAIEECSLDVSVDLEGLAWADSKKWLGKWGKVLGAPVGGMAAGVAAGWAIANWWNPTGWVAAGLVMLVGGMTTMGIGTVAQVCQESGRNDIERERSKLRRRLREQLATIRDEQVLEPALRWLNGEIAKVEANIEKGLVVLGRETGDFLKAGDRFVTALETTRNAAALHSIKALLALSLPTRALDEIQVVAVARRMNYRTKIAVRGTRGQSATGHLIGREGKAIRDVRRHLSGQSVDVVEFGPGPLGADTVRAALLPARLGSARIDIQAGDRRQLPVVTVHVASSDEARFAFGKRKWNLRLAEALLECRIVITTPARKR